MDRPMPDAARESIAARIDASFADDVACDLRAKLGTVDDGGIAQLESLVRLAGSRYRGDRLRAAEQEALEAVLAVALKAMEQRPDRSFEQAMRTAVTRALQLADRCLAVTDQDATDANRAEQVTRLLRDEEARAYLQSEAAARMWYDAPT